MGPLDAFWHLLNFFAPAIGVGALTPLLAKLLWRRELRAVPWRQLSLWAVAMGGLSWVAALVLLGRDGRMLAYAALLCTCALVVWWRGFVARR